MKRKRNKYKQCWLLLKNGYKDIAKQIARKNGEPSEFLAEQIAQMVNSEFNSLTPKGTIDYELTLTTFEQYLGLRYTFAESDINKQITGELYKLMVKAKQQFEVKDG